MGQGVEIVELDVAQRAAMAQRAADLDALVTLGDLLRLPGWLLAKAFYALAPASLRLRAAGAAGALLPLPRAQRSAIRDALAQHLPRNERASVERRHRRFLARVRLARLWPQLADFPAGVSVEGLEHLDEALAAGRGAVLVGVHFGHGRLVQPVLHAHGCRVVCVGSMLPAGRPLSRFGLRVRTRLLRLPRWSQLDARCRETVGADVRVGFDVRPLAEALERNETLLMLVDGRKAQALVPVSVLGIGVHLAPGPLGLARATGAAALPVFALDEPRSGDGVGIRVVVHAPLEPADDAEAAFAEIYERHVRSRPENFYWGAVRDGRFDPRLAER